ncbi:translationally-controlled tumor protein homolog isoform X2 [Octopus sinensis]|uniref:Translationally-controlled tumor protein homolog isoform X2 n=1 Tax=Octopus sinensis TaxID=2607531 RepID=A0A7E6EU68_9MOLL|nr:translationally-controlled tumor protein homolog isoform X2 [Octopus sinensis]
MLIYNDLLTGDELFSDAFPIKDVLDVALEVEGKYVTGQSQSYDIGANPSAEEAAESYDDTSAGGLDIVLSHRLKEIYIDKAYLKDYLKDYSKKILELLKAKDTEKADHFKSNAPAVVKRILGRFKELRFFVGESDEIGAIMMLDHRDDETPFFIVFKDGLEAMKC